MGVVYLATDYGYHDPYAGILKSRIYSINPKAKVVDLSHALIPFDVEFASWFLYLTDSYLESPKVLCMVVDPGVGTERKPLIVKHKKSYYILPDNGIISLLVRSKKEKLNFYEIRVEKLLKIYRKRIKERKLQMPLEVSQTFHGRDIFAPAAGLLSLNPEYLEDIASRVSGAVLLENLPEPVTVDTTTSNEENTYYGKVVYHDHYGNLVTNFRISESDGNERTFLLQLWDEDKVLVSLDTLSLKFADAGQKDFVAYRGSFGFLEIAMNQGSALETLGGWKKVKTLQVVLYYK